MFQKTNPQTNPSKQIHTFVTQIHINKFIKTNSLPPKEANPLNKSKKTNIYVLNTNPLKQIHKTNSQNKSI